MWKGACLDAMLVGAPSHCVCVGGFDVIDAVEPARLPHGAHCDPVQNRSAVRRG
jgi:hypothetical protein